MLATQQWNIGNVDHRGAESSGTYTEKLHILAIMSAVCIDAHCLDTSRDTNQVYVGTFYVQQLFASLHWQALTNLFTEHMPTKQYNRIECHLQRLLVIWMRWKLATNSFKL